MYGITTDYASPTVEKAPTLIEVLMEALERLEDLEARVDRIEIHQRTQQLLVSDDKHDLNSEYGVFGQYLGGHVVEQHREISDEYYGDGMKGDHDAE